MRGTFGPRIRLAAARRLVRARLHRILNEHGLRNGTAIFLPYDQGLEHGPRDFFANPAVALTTPELGADIMICNDMLTRTPGGRRARCQRDLGPASSGRA